MKQEHLPLYAIALAILVVGLAFVGVPIETILIGLVVLACPLMMLSMFATTRSSSASHPQTGHQPTPSRLSPSQMPVHRERSLR